MHKTVRRISHAVVLSLAAGAAQAAVIYQADLTPEVAGATGSGFVRVTHDPGPNTLVIEANWDGLSGLHTVAHIHCCTAVPFEGTVGVAVTPGTLPGLPNPGPSSGSYISPFPIDLDDASSFTANFVDNFAGGVLANADDALFNGISQGRAYFNLHSTTFPGGEIRGFLQQVPEPGTLAMLGLGLAALAVTRRRQA